MSTIAESTINLGTPVIQPPSAPSVVAEPIVVRPVLRGVLPVSSTLQTVTAEIMAHVNAPFQATWQTAQTVTDIVAQTNAISKQTSVGAPGIPAQVVEVTAQQEPYTAHDQTESLVIVSFKRWTTDKYFAGVQIWFSGYKGNPKPQLMATGHDSPISFTCEATKETVTVTVVAYGPTGLTAAFAQAPTTTVNLSGVINPPPAPTIAQPVTAISGGWQFAWNCMNGLVGDQIAGYWVYKSDVNTLPIAPAKRVFYQVQPATNVGILTYQDIDSATEYFWVSAVNSSGLESALTTANVSTVTAILYPTTGPAASFDGNETTYSEESAYASGYGGAVSTVTDTWSGWAAYAGLYTGASLQVMLSSDMAATVASYGPECSGIYSLDYSLDSGVTWHGLAIYGSKSYVTAPVPLGQDMTKIRVRSTISVTQAAAWTPPPYPSPPVVGVPSITVSQNIYEIHVELTGAS